MHELERLLLAAEVERARRLVEEEDRRLLRERPREHGALQLAAAQRAQRALRELAELEPLERVLGRQPVVAALGAEVAEVRRAAEQHVLGHGQLGRRLGDLRHERRTPRKLAGGRATGCRRRRSGRRR